MVSIRIESTTQIARKLHKSISSLVAYEINVIYLLSGDNIDAAADCQLNIYLTLAIFHIFAQKPFVLI